MKSENFIVIQGWMCNELELKGNELLVFALIYGFSQDGASKFRGTRQYIADTFNISRPTVDKALQGLLDKQYICKEGFDDFVNPNVYWVNLEDVKKLYTGCKETLQGGCKETLLNNTNKQTNRKKEVVSKDTTTEFSFGTTKVKKESLFTKCVSLIDAFITAHNCDNKVRRKLISYLNYRLSIKDKPLYTNMWKGMLGKLAELCNDNDYESIIDQSIERGYLSFYPVSNGKSFISSESGSRHVPRMTKEDYEKEAEHLAELEASGKRVRF